MSCGPRPAQNALSRDLQREEIRAEVAMQLPKVLAELGDEVVALLLARASERGSKPPAAPTLSVIENSDHSEQPAKKTPPLRVVKSDGGAA
jgi:hypothetical protein